MIVNESGSFMSQKKVPNLCHITPSIHDNHLILNCEGEEWLLIKAAD